MVVHRKGKDLGSLKQLPLLLFLFLGSVTQLAELVPPVALIV